MTWGGWISMTLSIGLVTALFLWCCRQLVRNSVNAPNNASDDADDSTSSDADSE